MPSTHGAFPRHLLYICLSVLRVAAQSPGTLVALFDETRCASKAEQDLWSPRPQDATQDGNNCIETLPTVVRSLMVLELPAGCGATFYSDMWCTHDGTVGERNECGGIAGGGEIRSLSIDLCDVPFAASGGRNVSVTTSGVADSTGPTAVADGEEEEETSTRDGGGGGLSTASKAGIGIGVAFGVGLWVSAFIMFFITRRRARGRREEANTRAGREGWSDWNEMGRSAGLTIVSSYELPSQLELREVSTVSGHQELPGEHGMSELWPGRELPPQELDGKRR